MNDREAPELLREVRRRSLLGVAAAAGLFALVVGVLLLFNQRALLQVDPLNNTGLDDWKQQVQQAPDDPELRRFLREYDLVVRQEYADRMQFRRTGSFLLAGSLALLLLSYHLAQRGRRPSVRVPAVPGSSQRQNVFAWALVAVAGFCVVVLGLALQSEPAGPVAATGGAATDAPAHAVASVAPDAAKNPPAEGIAPDYRPTREQWLANWPCFRGPLQNGIVPASLAPAAVASKIQILWKVKVPRAGMGSPVVWDGRVFLSGATSHDTQEIYCFSAQDGGLLWTLKIPQAGGDAQARAALGGDAGFAAPTMITDGRRVCAIFATGDVAAADFGGHLLWSVNLGVPENHYGYASSLAYYDGLVIAQWDNAAGRKLVALSIVDGKPVWQTPRSGEMSWSSPVMLDAGEGARLLTTAAPFVIAYDPATGRELWRCESLSGEVAPTATANGKLFFTAMQYSNLTAIRPGGAGDISKTHVVWRYPDNLPDTSSPLANAEYVFCANSAGFLSCLSAATGEQLWEQTFDATFFASPVQSGGTVFLVDNKGGLRLFAAQKEYHLLGELQLAEECGGASPACAGGLLFLRGREHLFCLAPGTR